MVQAGGSRSGRGRGEAAGLQQQSGAGEERVVVVVGGIGEARACRRDDEGSGTTVNTGR